MSLLPRVRYLLEVFLVQAPLNIRTQLLAILTRVARHSTGAASQVIVGGVAMGAGQGGAWDWN